MKEMIQNAVDAIRAVAGARPSVGLILGSGLAAADVLEDASFVDMLRFPAFPFPPRRGTRDVLCGRLAGHGVVCMQGRFHFYEGHPMSHIAAPVRVMKALGVETLLVTNACGGVNLDFQVGDLMVIDDHINFMGANPLTGPNDAGFGPRFCDMTYAYTPALRRLADEVAAAQGVALRHGVYLGYMGPSYETPAEIRAFRVLGADAVVMSTVPEVIAASHCGLPALAISLVTNMAAGVLEKKLDENEVIETAAARAKVLERLVTGIVERL